MSLEYLIGLDVGQQNDYTVLSIIKITPMVDQLIYGLVYLMKFPLRTSYTNVTRTTASLINKNFINEEYIMIVDYTGVGRPIVDLLREENLSIIAANITSGSTPNWKNRREVSIPKKDIISSLQVVFQSKRIKIAYNIKLFEDIKKEFINFKAKTSNVGRRSFSASGSHHDDIVMSIGLAIWYGEHNSKRKKRIRIATGN